MILELGGWIDKCQYTEIGKLDIDVNEEIAKVYILMKQIN